MNAGKAGGEKVKEDVAGRSSKSTKNQAAARGWGSYILFEDPAKTRKQGFRKGKINGLINITLPMDYYIMAIMIL